MALNYKKQILENYKKDVYNLYKEYTEKIQIIKHDELLQISDDNNFENKDGLSNEEFNLNTDIDQPVDLNNKVIFNSIENKISYMSENIHDSRLDIIRTQIQTIDKNNVFQLHKKARINFRKRKLYDEITFNNKKIKKNDHDLPILISELKIEKLDQILKKIELLEKTLIQLKPEKESVDMTINEKPNFKDISFYQKNAFATKMCEKSYKKTVNITNILTKYQENNNIKTKSRILPANNVKNRQVLMEKIQVKVPKYFRSEKEAFNSMCSTKQLLKTKYTNNMLKKNSLNIDKLSPIELYKKSIDASFEKNTINLAQLNYKPKTFIPKFKNETEMKKYPIISQFVANINLKNIVKNQNCTIIRKILGNQTEINVEQIFQNKVTNVTNTSPNKFKKIK